MNKLKVGSDFSGVGAFDQALIRLGIDYETVFSCDMDKYARQTYIHNYGEPKYYPKNVYNREIPKESLDIYMTSPPCQSFSLAGKRKGKDSDNGVLFFNSHEFIQENNPRYFIFENVKGLLSDDNGKTFSEWCNMLGGKSINGMPVLFPYDSSVPYHIYHKVLNTKKYGVPQNRERVFIIGIRDDVDNHFTWPKDIPLEKRLKDVLEKDVDPKYFLSDSAIQSIILNDNNLQKSKVNPEVANALQTPGNACGVYKGMTAISVKSATKKGYETAKEGVITNFQGKEYSNTIRTGGKGSMTDKHNWDGVRINDHIRRLTPRECFRLQDFPDSFTWPVSDSQAYKQAGNSITVAVLYNIVTKLLTNNS